MSGVGRTGTSSGGCSEPGMGVTDGVGDGPPRHGAVVVGGVPTMGNQGVMCHRGGAAVLLRPRPSVATPLPCPISGMSPRICIPPPRPHWGPPPQPYWGVPPRLLAVPTLPNPLVLIALNAFKQTDPSLLPARGG